MKRRVLIFTFSFIAGFFLQSCAVRKHKSYNPKKYQQVSGEGYAYKKVNDGEYVVAAVDKQALQRALTDIGCDKSYVCLVEPDGEYYSVQQRKRQ